MEKQVARTVLLVEDSPVQTRIIQNHIETLTPFKVITAATLEETGALLEEHKNLAGQNPEAGLFIAVVDLNLPDAPDGEAADKCIASGVPSIVLTASFDESVRARFFDRNVVDYFLKGSVRDMDPMVAALIRVFHNQFVRALVVDDSRTARHQMAHLLEVQQFQVLQAEDGKQALEIIEAEGNIGLVITDDNMPRMTGVELVSELRQRYRPDEMGLIGVSAAGSGPLTARFLKNGASDFLTKPFEVEEFYWRVNQTMEKLDMMRDLMAYRKGKA
ncbi:response regulator [Oleidesulfovibrio sp.]|uniref:response regulator n=1 Tax=Oleidesulfovibrio sp. TaxID=2909707 RepID=UPI003A876C19